MNQTKPFDYIKDIHTSTVSTYTTTACEHKNCVVKRIYFKRFFIRFSEVIGFCYDCGHFLREKELENL